MRHRAASPTRADPSVRGDERSSAARAREHGRLARHTHKALTSYPQVVLFPAPCNASNSALSWAPAIRSTPSRVKLAIQALDIVLRFARCEMGGRTKLARECVQSPNIDAFPRSPRSHAQQSCQALIGFSIEPNGRNNVNRLGAERSPILSLAIHVIVQ